MFDFKQNMIILLSPAKTIQFEQHQTKLKTTFPEFEKDADFLNEELKKKSFGEIKSLMKTSDSLTELTMNRILKYKNNHATENLKPSILAYMGAVYAGLQAWNFSENEMQEAQNRLRILSGFYGILRPLDQIQAHRLELGFKLLVNDNKDLYQFWIEKVNHSIISALNRQNTNVILNLASKEYSDVVDFKKIGARVVSPVFKNWRINDYKTVTILTKRARGLMASFIIRNFISNDENICGFDLGGYYYNKELSKENKPFFTSEF